jgi:hypothetical protein
LWLVLSGPRPRLEFAVGVEEDAKNLRNKRLRVYRLTMYVLVIG